MSQRVPVTFLFAVLFVLASLSSCHKKSRGSAALPAISASLSTATANPATNVTAGGGTTSTISVTVMDVNGALMSGQSVLLTSTGSNNTFVQPAVTDANGVATGTIVSTMAETKTITITVNAGPDQVVLTNQPTVTFIGGAVSAVNSTVVASPTSLSNSIST